MTNELFTGCDSPRFTYVKVPECYNADAFGGKDVFVERSTSSSLMPTTFWTDTSEAAASSDRKNTAKMAVGLGCGALGLLTIAIVAACLWHRKHKKGLGCDANLNTMYIDQNLSRSADQI